MFEWMELEFVVGYRDDAKKARRHVLQYRSPKTTGKSSHSSMEG